MAYSKPGHIYFDQASSTLAVAGTDFGKPTILQDLYDDLVNVPTNNMAHTLRYEQLKQMIAKYHPRTIVSHSLGAATAGAFAARNPHYQGSFRMYGWPVVHLTENDPRITSFRGALDPIAAGDLSGHIYGLGHNI